MDNRQQSRNAAAAAVEAAVARKPASATAATAVADAEAAEPAAESGQKPSRRRSGEPRSSEPRTREPRSGEQKSGEQSERRAPRPHATAAAPHSAPPRARSRKPSASSSSRSTRARSASPCSRTAIVAEVYLERPEQRSIAGNIYLGTVDNVLPGMEAAFVEIGLEKNGFLYVDEIVGPELEGRRGARKIQDLIQRGQTVLVQAVKDPMKTKGARLTTEISLPGRFVVYVPHGDGLGVSRRLDDDERNRLKAIVKEIAPPTGGVIVRTAAEGASAEDVARDLDFLRRLWETIEASAKKAQAPALIYQEAELPLRVTRDLFTGDFERLLVDHDRTYKRIVGYLKKTSPHMVERVTRYKEREPLLEALRRRAGDPLDAQPPRRPALRRLPDLRLRRGVHRDRRQHRPLRRLALEAQRRRPARGHDHEEQPRSGQGGRPPAPAARRRRDHRHRLHRHGEPEEPPAGRGRAPARARARPHEDLRGRDLAARPRRDDAPERHRRAARDHDPQVPDLRRRRDRRLGGDGRGRGRAAAARARSRPARARRRSRSS